MSKQRGTFFGLMSKIAMVASMMKWQGKQAKEENQKYGSPIYIPKRGKLKGYQKELRFNSFNKNK